MRKSSLALHYQAFFHAAALGAESNFRARGFRQKDFRFLLELFANWMECSLPGGSLGVHNAQVSRYLNDLVSHGLARKNTRGTQPRYNLTRAGVISVLQSLVDRNSFLPFEQWFFVHYFVRQYGARIDELAKEQGAQFPRALKLEIEALRDPADLVARQLRFVEKEIRKLEERISEARLAALLARKLFADGVKFEEVVAEVQKKHPYDLNNQKPMRELFSELPEAMRRMEIEHGNHERADLLWEPVKDFLENYRKALKAAAISGASPSRERSR